jgi:ABC-type Zn uptake system ZnuABC Zn-binding protein ZnuA
MHLYRSFLIIIIIGLSIILYCDQKQNPQKNDKLKILATTTIIADVVKNICGDRAIIESLLPLGASPHSFEAVPRDLAKIDRADILFINGGGLERFLEKLVNHSKIKGKTISLSENIEFLYSEDSGHEKEHEHGHVDPHVWMDPQNVLIWANTIEKVLCEKDSGNCEFYKKNADVYRLQLNELNIWIANQFKYIDENKRKIITDHRMLGYYAERYGLEHVGTIIQGFSALAEPSAREIAQLEDEIRKLKVKAILIGINVNPALAERITQDTGTNLIRFYSGSLSERGGPADTYLKYMRFNTQAIVSSLN